jgi:glycosyltransferase involved in cell wall biosynthesis
MPVGGAEDLVAGIVRGLNREQFFVQAATIGPGGEVARELNESGHPVISLNLDLKGTPFFVIVSRIRQLLQQARPHILHTHLYHPNLYGRLAALGMGLRGVVASIHNSYTGVKAHRCLWNFLLAFFSHRLLVSSPKVYDDVRRWDRVPPRKLLVFPYGINLAELGTPLTRDQARTRLGINGFVLGMVGRLEEQKGHRHLLEALPELVREIPDLTVLLVGEGRQEEALKHLARALGVEDRVRFLGTRRDLPMIFKAMDLFVQPSLWEGLPLTLLMAMGAGLPVVATKVSGVQDVLAEGVNGLLVDPGDSRGLAGAVLRLYGDPALRTPLAAAGRETVARHYSREAMLQRLEALYLGLAGKGAAA